MITSEIVEFLCSILSDLKRFPSELAAIDKLVDGHVELKHLLLELGVVSALQIVASQHG